MYSSIGSSMEEQLTRKKKRQSVKNPNPKPPKVIDQNIMTRTEPSIESAMEKLKLKKPLLLKETKKKKKKKKKGPVKKTTVMKEEEEEEEEEEDENKINTDPPMRDYDEELGVYMPYVPIQCPRLKRERREFNFSDNMLEEDEKESKLGIHILPNPTHNKLGWLLTFASGLMKDSDSDKVYSCVDLYFVSEDGSKFKCKYKFNPYFYVEIEEGTGKEAEEYLKERYKDKIVKVEMVQKEVLEMRRQCSPSIFKSYLKVFFETANQLIDSREDLRKMCRHDHYNKDSTLDILKCIIGCDEADVPYLARFAIDNDIRCGQWYIVSTSNTGAIIEKRTDISQPPDVRVCALHVEYGRNPQLFKFRPIVMISYMVDGKGYLLVNREYVGDDIKDFSYTPRIGGEGHFKVQNVQNEVELLKCWFARMREVKPCIYATCNGEGHDCISLQRRADFHGIVMNDEIGFGPDLICSRGYRSKFACHIDCFSWLRRDRSFSSRIAVAIKKIQYSYSEDMVRGDKGLSQWLACHSVSEAVVTCIIYMTFVHPYIFSLAAQLPLPPDEIMRLETHILCSLFCRTLAYKAGYIVGSTITAEAGNFHIYPLVDQEQTSESKWLIDTERVDGESLRECMWYAKEKGCLALVRKLYNQMRADHLVHVRKSAEQALKVMQIGVEKETISDVPQETSTNFIDFSWIFPKEVDEDLKEFKFPEFRKKTQDLDSWTKIERSNLRFRIFKAIQDVGVGFPIDSFSKEVKLNN